MKHLFLSLLSTLIVGTSFGQAPHDVFYHGDCNTTTISGNVLSNDVGATTVLAVNDIPLTNGVNIFTLSNGWEGGGLPIQLQIEQNGAFTISGLSDSTRSSYYFSYNTAQNTWISVNIIDTAYCGQIYYFSGGCDSVVGFRNADSIISVNNVPVQLGPNMPIYYFTATDINGSGNQKVFAIQYWYDNHLALVDIHFGDNPGLYKLEYVAINNNINDTITIFMNIDSCEIDYCRPTSVDISPGGWFRRCDTAVYNVYYSNYNQTPLNNGYVDVQLDNSLTFVNSAQTFQNLGNGLIRFDIGNLPAWHEGGYFSFDAYINCNGTVLGQTHCASASIFPHNTCVSGIDSFIICNLPDSNSTDSVYFRVISNVNGVSTQYRVYEDEFLGRTGIIQLSTTPKIIAYKRNPLSSIHRIEVDAISNSIHVNQTPSAFIVSDTIIDTTGIINTSPVGNGEPWISYSCRQNTDSYDPNMKEAFPKGYGDNHYINQNVDLDYVIHFQNEGTADALKVVVEDEIDSDLDINTFVGGAATHPYTVTKVNGNTIRFTFNNINLTPKLTDEAGSMGFVKFNIRQKVNNPIGTVITNSAKIYFDYNSPITTNTVTHIIEKPETYSKLVTIEEIKGSFNVSIFPNPATSIINFATKDGVIIEELELLDFAGRTIVKQHLNSEQTTLSVSEYAKGIYFYKLKGKGTYSTGKIIIE